MSSVWPGGSSRWARPPASQPPEAAASSAQCRSPRGGSWGSWRKGWAMTRRGIRCWPLRRCSRTAAPLPDAHGVRSQPRFFFVSLSLSLLLLLSWVVVPVLITFCVLSLAPILGCAVLLPSSRRAAASIKHGQLSPVTRAHQHSSPIKNTPGGHISSRPRTPCAQAQTPNDSHAHGCTQCLQGIS